MKAGDKTEFASRARGRGFESPLSLYGSLPLAEYQRSNVNKA